MNERQAAVLAEVNKEWAGTVSTHYRDCYRVHAACLAAKLKQLEETE